MIQCNLSLYALLGKEHDPSLLLMQKMLEILYLLLQIFMTLTQSNLIVQEHISPFQRLENEQKLTQHINPFQCIHTARCKVMNLERANVCPDQCMQTQSSLKTRHVDVI